MIGPWRLGRPLGAGGMGTIYRAEHVDTGRILGAEPGVPCYTGQPSVASHYTCE